MANKKISELTAKGTTLAATDLIEISESDGAGGYVTKSVTGANVNSTEIGALIGGGVVVAVFNENGVNKALVASLTNVAANISWTITAFQTTLIGATAQSYHDGLTNTNAIIAQTGAPASTAYAAGIARLFAGGGFSDWYLPSTWELNMCYNSAAITGKVSGVTSFLTTTYWSSTEALATTANSQVFSNAGMPGLNKSTGQQVRAVRIHTI
jgi:hypothetical protein